MADLNVIYRIAADITGLQDGVKRAADATESLDQKVGKAAMSIAGAFGIAFSVSAVKNWAVSVVKAGSDIQDLSQKLGVSTGAVQRWSYAAELSGASMDTVDRAVAAMNRTLSAGGTGTIDILDKIGLSFADVRRMSPEEAFDAITLAVSKVEDPMLRAEAAQKLFLKSGQELLPAIMEGFAATAKGAAVMSDETIKRLDAAGDAWTRLSHSATIHSGEFIAAVQRSFSSWREFSLTFGTSSVVQGHLRGVAESAAELQASVDAAAKKIPPLDDGLQKVGMSSAQTDAAIADLDRQVRRSITTNTEAATALRKAAEDQKAFEKAVRVFKPHAVNAGLVIDDMTGELSELSAEFRAYDLLPTIENTDRVSLSSQIAAKSIKTFSEHVEDGTTKTDTWSTQLGLLGDSFAQLAQIGGDSLSGLTRGIGSVISSVGMGIQSVGTFKTGFSQLGAGNMLGGITSIASGIGGIVSIAQTAIGVVKALWSWAQGGEEGSQVNPAREKWFAERGGTVESVAARLAEHGIFGEDARRLIDAVFQADTMKKFNEATGAIPFAQGGLVRQPTLAMIGEAGPEVVTPLSQLGGLMGPSVIHNVIYLDGRIAYESNRRHQDQDLRTRMQLRPA